MGHITKPNTFTSQTKILSAQVNDNFDTLYTQVNAHDDTLTTHDNEIGILSTSIFLDSYPKQGAEADDTARINRAITAATSGKKDLIIKEDVDYVISSPITFTCSVIGKGKPKITGSYVKLEAQKGRKLHNLIFDELRISGTWFCDYRNITVYGEMKIDGRSSDWGTVYNRFNDVECLGITIDTTLAFINLNQFENVRSPFDGSGLSMPTYGLRITGTTNQCHANTFKGCDFSRMTSDTAVLNDSSLNEPNLLEGCYIETNKGIIGNFNVLGLQGDGTEVTVDGLSTSQIILNTSVTAREFSQLPLSAKNLAVGGDFSRFNSSGLPSGFTALGGVTTSVVKDSTAPNRYGKTVHVSATGTFQGLDIKLSNSSGLAGLTGKIYYKGTLSNVSLLGGNFGSETFPSDVGTSRSYSHNGWKVYRFSVANIVTGNPTLRLYINAGTAASNSLDIGRVEVTEGRFVNHAHSLPDYQVSGSISDLIKEINGDVMTLRKTYSISTTTSSPITQTFNWAKDLVDPTFDPVIDTFSTVTVGADSTKGLVKYRSGPNDTVLQTGLSDGSAVNKVIVIDGIKYDTLASLWWTNDAIILGTGDLTASFTGSTVNVFDKVTFTENPFPMISVSGASTDTHNNYTKLYSTDIDTKKATIKCEFATSFSGKIHVMMSGRIR